MLDKYKSFIQTGGMIEADSIESLPAQLHHRASLTHSRLMSTASPNTSPSPSQANRISRSNSIRFVLLYIFFIIMSSNEINFFLNIISKFWLIE